MKLSELIKGLEIVYRNGDMNLDIDEIFYDSRKTTEKSLFVAIDGFKTDGHDYIEEAINKGAVAIVMEENKNIDTNIILIKVKDTRLALAKIASNFYNYPSAEMNLIGVTGTNGKTTTTYLVKSIFEAANKKIGIVGTIGSVVGSEKVKTQNTTPESLDLQRTFDMMVKSNIDNCIMEVSSHALELNRVAYSNFNVGIFTNLSVDHLDFHKNMDNYLNAKKKLFYNTQKCNIINIDDKYGEKIVKEISKLKTSIVTYGIEKESNVRAENIELLMDGSKFNLITPKGSIDIKLNIPGTFSVYNGLAAASCGYAYDISLQNIKKGLESIKGVRGRFEIVPTNRDFTVIIDFAHTPDGFEKVMQTINQFAKGRKIVLFGAGGERGKTRRKPMGEIVAKYSDLCVITTDNPRTENSEDIIKDIVAGVEKVKGKYMTFIDRKKAIEYVIKNSQTNDVILLAGKGHETYQIIGEKILPFDEKTIVLDILRNM